MPLTNAQRQARSRTRRNARYKAMESLLRDVDAYYRGDPPFSFHRLPADQRQNEAFDAWQEIHQRIRVILGNPKHEAMP